MKKCLTMALFMFGFAVIAGELSVGGEFKLPRKPGMPPAGWNRISGGKGSMEIISSGDGNSVMLSGDAGMRFGIYSQPVAAKAGDKIKVTAFVRGEKVILGVFQYSTPAGTAAQRQTVTASPEGKEVEAVFTVADTQKGKTDRIRVCLMVEKDAAASFTNVKAFLIE